MSDASIAETSPAQAPDEAQSRRADLTARVKNGIQIMHVTWGLAWFLGNGLFFLRSGPGNKVLVDIPSWLPLTVLLGLLVVASGTTAILGVRVFGRGATDPTYVRQAKWYGTAWLLGFVGLLITVGKATHGLSSDEQGMIWIITTTGLAATLQLAGSAIWLDRGQLRLGLWLMLVNVVGVLAGQGWQALIVSVAGGGVMLYLGVVGMLRGRQRSRVPVTAL
jgi:hypothetical protein